MSKRGVGGWVGVAYTLYCAALTLECYNQGTRRPMIRGIGYHKTHKLEIRQGKGVGVGVGASLHTAPRPPPLQITSIYFNIFTCDGAIKDLCSNTSQLITYMYWITFIYICMQNSIYHICTRSSVRNSISFKYEYPR